MALSQWPLDSRNTTGIGEEDHHACLLIEEEVWAKMDSAQAEKFQQTHWIPEMKILLSAVIWFCDTKRFLSILLATPRSIIPRTTHQEKIEKRGSKTLRHIRGGNKDAVPSSKLIVMHHRSSWGGALNLKLYMKRTKLSRKKWISEWYKDVNGCDIMRFIRFSIVSSLELAKTWFRKEQIFNGSQDVYLSPRGAKNICKAKRTTIGPHT